MSTQTDAQYLAALGAENNGVEDWDGTGEDDAQYEGPTPEQQQAAAQAALRQQSPASPQAPQQGQPSAAELMALVQQQHQLIQQLTQPQAKHEAAPNPLDAIDPNAPVAGWQVQELLARMQQNHSKQLSDMQAQMQTQFHQNHVHASVQAAKQMYPDAHGADSYTNQIQKLADLQSDPHIGPLVKQAMDAALQAPNPALAAYQLAKRFATPGEHANEIAQLAAQVAPQLTPQGPKGPRTLNTIPNAGAPSTAPSKGVSYAEADPRKLAKMSPQASDAAWVQALKG